MEARAVVLAFLFSLLAGCSDSTEGPALPVLEPKGPRLLVTATDYVSPGRLYVIELSTQEILPTVFSIASDPFVRFLAGEKNYFVFGRYRANYLRPVPVNLSRILPEISTGADTNPQDIVKAAPGLAYVSLLDENRISIFDLNAGAFTGHVALGAHADADGISEYAHMTVHGGRVLVAAQRLDRARRMQPTAFSEIVSIDPSTHAETAVQRTARTNPISPFKLGPDGDLFLAEAHKRFDFADNRGGIERLDKTTLVSKGIVLEESAIPGDLVDFEIVSANLGVVLALVAPGVNRLFKFDPATGVRGDVVLAGANDELHQIVMNRARTRLYVADRNRTRPGVRVFSLPDLVERSFIALTLEPYSMELHE